MSHKGHVPTIGELRLRKEVERANRAMVGFWGTVLGVRRVGTVGILQDGREGGEGSEGGAGVEVGSVKSSHSGGGAVRDVEAAGEDAGVEGRSVKSSHSDGGAAKDIEAVEGGIAGNVCDSDKASSSGSRSAKSVSIGGDGIDDFQGYGGRRGNSLGEGRVDSVRRRQ